MPFLQFLRSLDDLLYELMSWLIFFPVTLFRAIVSPLATMRYADRELSEDVDRQYDETLSPPQFLLVSLLTSHFIELAVVGQSELVTDKVGLAALVSDDTSLLLLRLAFFSFFPIIIAFNMVRHSGKRLTRDTLRDPFYAQCFPVGPFALALSVGTIAGQIERPWIVIAGAFLMLASVVWFLAVQVLWFHQRLQIHPLKAVAVAVWAVAQCVVALAGVMHVV